jgi:hypothetical protein
MGQQNLSEAQQRWAETFIGTYVKGTSTSWMVEGIVLGYTRGQRGRGVYLITEKGRIYRRFPTHLVVSS